MVSKADDFVAVQQLVLGYSAAASRGDAGSIAASFTERGVLAGFAALVGRDDAEIHGQDGIRGLFEGFLPGIEFIHQMAQLVALEITGDTARGEVMVSECVRWRDQPVSLFLARYADELVRTADGWRFAKRTLLPRAVMQMQTDLTIF